MQLDANFTRQDEERLLQSLEAYIAKAGAADTDLLVFPEYTLGVVHTTLDDPR